jgi:hypothetical protein
MSGPSEKISQAEKRDVLMNDKRVRDQQTHMKLAELFWQNERKQRDTMHNRTSADLDLENQGRFAKAQNVAGTTPIVQYPQLPAGNPWADAPLGNERPLGYSINDQDAVGEYREILASLSNPATSSGAEEAPRGDDGQWTDRSTSLDNHPTGPDADPRVASSAPARPHHPSGVAGPVPKPKLGVL